MSQECGKQMTNEKCPLYFEPGQESENHVCYCPLGKNRNERQRFVINIRYVRTSENGQYCQHCIHCHKFLETINRAIESLKKTK